MQSTDDVYIRLSLYSILNWYPLEICQLSNSPQHLYTVLSTLSILRYYYWENVTLELILPSCCRNPPTRTPTPKHKQKKLHLIVQSQRVAGTSRGILIFNLMRSSSSSLVAPSAGSRPLWMYHSVSIHVSLVWTYCREYSPDSTTSSSHPRSNPPAFHSGRSAPGISDRASRSCTQTLQRSIQ